MKRKNVFLLCAVIISLPTLEMRAQNELAKADDMGRIVLNAYVPDQAEELPSSAERMLENKMRQIATANGMGGSLVNPRFVIAPEVSVISKNITSTAPPMTALTMEVTVFIGDAMDGKIFSSESFELKGVGTNETKAYISGIKNIRPKNPAIQDCVEEGKQRIIEFYNSQCDFIIKEAHALESQNQFDEAIFKLMTVPEVCKDCFDKCMEAVEPIFQKQIDRECKINLAEAQAAWNAGQNRAAADAARIYLAGIEPEASCFGDAETLSQQIAKHIQALDQRAWDFKMKQYEDNAEYKRSRLEAIRQIGVTFANNRPKEKYVYPKSWRTN